MSFQDFDLRQDPFPITPEGSVHNWAGDQELREDLVDLVKGVRATDIGVTEFAILHGEYGAGKSHSLRYLKTLISENADEFGSLVIYLDRPRVASKFNFESLVKYIFVEIGRDRISKYSEQVSEIMKGIAKGLAEQQGLGHLQNLETFYEQAYSSLPDNDRAMVKLLVRGVQPDSSIFEFLTGSTKAPEYESKIDSDFLAAKVLGDFLRVLTSEFPDESRILNSSYLFIDESEMLLEAKASESEALFTGFRELLNALPYRFCFLMSATAQTALIEAVMSTHLLKRMTREFIEVPMLSDEMAHAFILAQMDFYRTEDSEHKGTFYPFSPDAIDLIIENEVSLTPRNLFVQCKRVFERATRRHGIEPGEEISKDLAAKILGIL